MSETGVKLFDYVSSKEVFVESVHMSKCLSFLLKLPMQVTPKLEFSVGKNLHHRKHQAFVE